MATYNILMKRFAGGNDWDILRPLTISDNVSDVGQNNKFVTQAEKIWIEGLSNKLFYLSLPDDYIKVTKGLVSDDGFYGTEGNFANKIEIGGSDSALRISPISDGFKFTYGDGGWSDKLTYRTTEGFDGFVFLDKSQFLYPFASANYSPVDGQDLTTKTYVDNIALGVKPKTAVKVRTTSNIALTGISSIDGYTLVNSDRVLLVAQTNASQNGIYRWATGGGLTKLDSTENETGALVSVTNGTTGAGERWYNLNTTNGLWIQFDSQIDVQAGSGIAVSGATVSIATSGVTNDMLAGSINAGKLMLAGSGGLENSSGSLRIKASSVTNDMLAENISWSKFSEDEAGEGRTWGGIPTLQDAKTLQNHLIDIYSSIRLLRGTTSYNTNNTQTIAGAYTLGDGKNKTTLSNADPTSAGRVIGDLHFQYET